MSVLFPLLTLLVIAAVVVISYKVATMLEKRGYSLPKPFQWVPAMALMFMLGVQSFAQSTLDIDIDLSNFWQGFNEFFGALFPPLAFIASISAALGFIFLIINALKNAFSGRGGGQ